MIDRDQFLDFKIKLNKLKVWLYFVYYPYPGCLTPRALTPQAIAAYRAKAGVAYDQAVSAFVLAIVDLHFIVAGPIDGLSPRPRNAPAPARRVIVAG